ncbi:MAG: VanZ family protein [Magnetococcales bacterium]|nr:VanZ family protein [Magnetococcales bacterium]
MAISHKISSPIFWYFALIAYCAFIFYLSSQTLHIPGPEFLYQDKVFHATAYGLLAFLALRVASSFAEIPNSYLWAWLYGLAYGASDEWHQSFVPGRYADIWDWVADVFGATVVLVTIYILRRRKAILAENLCQ